LSHRHRRLVSDSDWHAVRFLTDIIDIRDGVNSLQFSDGSSLHHLSSLLAFFLSAFEQWCYRKMLKISWKDKVPNAEVLKRVGEKEQQFFRKIVEKKLAYAVDVLRESSGRNALVILEGKIRGIRPKGKPRRMWFDDVRQ